MTELNAFDQINQRGLTLVELVVALFISTLMAMLLLSGVKQGATIWEKVYAKQSLFQEKAQAMRFLKKQIEQAKVIRHSSLTEFDGNFGSESRANEGYNGTSLYGDKYEMAFSAPLATQHSPGGLFQVKIFSKKENKKNRLEFAYRPFVPGLKNKMKTMMLLESDEKFSFSYFGEHNPKESNQTWQDQWNNTEKLPRLIKVQSQKRSNRAESIIQLRHSESSQPVLLSQSVY